LTVPAPRLHATVFVCGCGHSGTTLIANMFAAHPEIHIPLTETNIFLGPEEDAAPGFAALEAEALAAGKRILVEKTPRHVRRIDRIRKVVPGARFVMPIRDGRDVTASIARRRKDHAAAAGAKRWIADNRLVLAVRDDDDVLAYRHEDLVADAGPVLASICEFAGIPFDERMLRYHEQDRVWFGQPEGSSVSSNEARHHELRNWQINQPIFDSSGKWREELDEADLVPLLSGPGRRLMEEFGYLSADPTGLGADDPLEGSPTRIS
jgi:hypothetical protein